MENDEVGSSGKEKVNLFEMAKKDETIGLHIHCTPFMLVIDSEQIGRKIRTGQNESTVFELYQRTAFVSTNKKLARVRKSFEDDPATHQSSS